jgi:FAD/FMN-containing dehydrogenase
MMRDLVLGLEVVLPDGRILDGLKPLRKDNTGYDLRNLFMGAEGTLGVITAASCKLFSRPATNVTAFVGLTDPQRAVSLLSRLRTFTGDAVSTFELIPRNALELVLEYIPNTANPLDQRHDWYVLLEIGMGRQAESMREAIEAELALAMEQGEIGDAAIASSESQREMFWRLRETIPEAQRHIGASIKHDVSVTTSELPQFIIEASQLVRAISPRGRIVSYGHLGDGNLHFNVSRPIDSDDESFLRLAPNINRAVHDLIARHGGSISAEHGIGRLKREELVRYEPPVAIEVMRAIKQALDPNGIMNPGKVL